MNTALQADGIDQIIDFSFYPFGNAFYANAEDTPNTCNSPYVWEGFDVYYNTTSPNVNKWDSSANGRACWEANCGVGSTSGWSDDECTAGTAIYQHGVGEGLVDAVESW